MNFGLCYAFHRFKNHCAGCNSTGSDKPNYCSKCAIKNCEFVSMGKSKYCYDCDDYPCKRIKNIDKRYRKRYGMSMIENLNSIKESGIRMFIKFEKQKWTCTQCGNIICVHRTACLVCGADRDYH